MKALTKEDKIVYIKAASMVAVVLLVIGGWLWWVGVYTAKDDVFFLQIGGKTVAKKFGPAGEAAANIPGVAGAADGPVNDMKGIGNGV